MNLTSPETSGEIGAKCVRLKPRSVQENCDAGSRRSQIDAMGSDPGVGEGILRDAARFVILEHQWNGVHWDLMLEQGGVLRTWALTRRSSRT